MTPDELKVLLTGLGLSQADFARLVGVTPRAVNLWMAGDRAIPGPAHAYAQLLGALPPNLLQVELDRLKKRGAGMREGMFGITFHGRQGAGMGMLVLEAGRVYGTDTEGAKYDGSYIFNESTGKADVVIKVRFPPNVVSVIGISNPYEWAIDVSTVLDPKQNAGTLDVRTSVGQPIKAQYKFLRGLPDTDS